jgi:serine O-acetyltransferase
MNCAEYGHQTLRGIRAHVRADILRDVEIRFASIPAGSRHALRRRLSSFLSPAVLAIFLHRLSHFFHARRWRRLATLFSRTNCYVFKINIPPQACAGPGLFIPHPAGVTFHAIAGRDVTLYSLAVCCTLETSIDGVAQAGPTLGDRVAVGRAMIFGPISVGSDAHIFAARVARDLPARSVAVSRITRLRMKPRELAAAS